MCIRDSEEALQRREGSHVFRAEPPDGCGPRGGGDRGTFAGARRYLGAREASKPTVYSRPRERGRGAATGREYGGPMAEVLTESFCERCGTRYTFEATAPHRRGTGRIRTLTRGVRNFVANDDASFGEAMAAAREDDTRSASSQQLDAFHLTFNFCMTCRQYTCLLYTSPSPRDLTRV